MASPLQILKDVFGYEAFRHQQADIVQHVTVGGNALVLMPTGGGKSLCYQVPALARKGVTIVISPLLALMRDQVQALDQAGVRAGELSSATSPADARRIKAAMKRGEMDLVYVAPERFTMDNFQELLAETPVSLFAIDEAHCVSQWGHDFRPEYLAVGKICAGFKDVPRIALTATADSRTRQDMIDRLFLQDARTFLSSFDRPNIRYEIVERHEPKQQLLRFMATQRGNSGIVYCLSRKKVDETAAYLRTQGYNALPYHAGMSGEDRARNQDRFIRGDAVVAVATVAFGMGIDKPDVRFVAHTDLPSSVEAYYQETGRAGRDGMPSVAWMSYGVQDVIMRRNMIADGEGNEAHKRSMRQRLQALVAMTESAECRRTSFLRYFGEKHPGGCANCDRCLRPVHTYDATVDAQKVMSAALRTGQRFGGGHLVEVLSGKKTDKISRFRHDAIPTFGIGKDKTPKHWHRVVQQITAAGLLDAPADNHGGLVVTDEGREVLKGQKPISLAMPPEDPILRGARIRREKTPTTAAVGVADDGQAAEILMALKAWRTGVARAQGVPPYVVMGDATLTALANERPSSVDDLTGISGIGVSRRDRYGQAIIEIMDQFRHPKDIEPGPGPRMR